MFKKYLKSFAISILFGLSVVFYGLHAQESPSGTPSDIEIEVVGEATPSSTDEGVEEIIDLPDENSTENTPTTTPPEIETVPEIVPLVILPEESELSIPNVVINKPLIPNRGEVNKKKTDIDYTNGSYLCEITPFSSTVGSGTSHATVKIKNLNQIGNQTRQLLVGELPYGFKIVFANDTFSQNVIGNQTEFPISIIKSSDAQKGSFVVPIFYSVGETTVMCQMNVVNHD